MGGIAEKYRSKRSKGAAAFCVLLPNLEKASSRSSVLTGLPLRFHTVGTAAMTLPERELM
jgi:hypothetical protein